jgi:hypothetical protein
VLVALAMVVTAGLAVGPASARSRVRACRNSALVVSHTAVDGATGHSAFVLLYKNVSGVTCTLHGYPGLDGITAKGHVLVHAKRTRLGFAGGAHVKGIVAIRPGHFASATVEWLNFNPFTSGPCRFSASIATTPAHTTKTVHFRVSVSACGLLIHPTVAGTSGRN